MKALGFNFWILQAIFSYQNILKLWCVFFPIFSSLRRCFRSKFRSCVQQLQNVGISWFHTCFCSFTLHLHTMETGHSFGCPGNGNDWLYVDWTGCQSGEKGIFRKKIESFYETRGCLLIFKIIPFFIILGCSYWWKSRETGFYKWEKWRKQLRHIKTKRRFRERRRRSHWDENIQQSRPTDLNYLQTSLKLS